MKIIIKANEELFNRWKQLGLSIELLGSIVQNNLEISQEQYQHNKDLWTNCRREFDDLQACTQLWIEYDIEVKPMTGQHKLQIAALGIEIQGDK